MPSFESGTLTINHARDDSAALRMDWLGRSDDQNPARALRPYLLTVLEDARREGVGIELHFERVDYFNSSTVSVLLDFVVQARKAGVPLRFIYSQAVRWQRLSFDALRVVSSLDSGLEVVSVEQQLTA